ncbi:GGDEF domain-containing protein [Kineococcus rhizosphaerae]|uniref:Diguanylate cyclase (GGDEF)-like protein n=1 Tax=Kineococcus rhizosphaerae TaxID=559628 RepID=A0A2T0R3W7_9ACTN|nr:GGDEF domain-containing protein [Kineococcus rhizosphaerae]PRY14711.1 diguanylate cyclase (GGDEF)-like protein [Kineococcus rhizosphaerae]
MRSRRAPAAGGLAAVAALAVLVLVDGVGGPVLQAAAATVPGIVATLVAVVRLRTRPAARRRAWAVQAAGLLVTTAGYPLFHLGLLAGLPPGYPLPADVFFLTGGALVVAAGVLLNRGVRDRGATADAAIAVTGLWVAVTALLVRPALADQPGVLAVVLTAAYPALDLANLALVLRLWLARRVPSGPAALFAGAFGCVLFGDSAVGALVEVAPVDLRPWFGLPFQVALLLVAAAVAHPRSGEVGLGPGRTRAWSTAHWVVVGGASCVPSVVLLVQGAAGGAVDWLVTGAGALVMSLLGVGRVHHALVRVQRTADDLAGQARTDELTRLPNRRSWDAELHRALASDQDVAVALLDLDHFKRLNDTHGHAEGDRVLRTAAANWRAALPEGAFLARHGGEEFALLLGGDLVARAGVVAERLLRACPAPQTVSIGLARRLPGEDTAQLLARADAELYRAKAAGRDRVCVAAPTG